MANVIFVHLLSSIYPFPRGFIINLKPLTDTRRTRIFPHIWIRKKLKLTADAGNWNWGNWGIDWGEMQLCDKSEIKNCVNCWKGLHRNSVRSTPWNGYVLFVFRSFTAASISSGRPSSLSADSRNGVHCTVITTARTKWVSGTWLSLRLIEWCIIPWLLVSRLVPVHLAEWPGQ